MSDPMTTPAPATAVPPTIFDKIEAFGHATLTAVEHGAVWLVGEMSNATTTLSALEATSPLVSSALAAGGAAAAAHGVPVVAIENAGGVLLSLAKEFVGSLMAPPPPVPMPPPVPTAA